MMGFYVKVALLAAGSVCDLAAMARELLYPVEADRVLHPADDDRLAGFALEPWLKVLSDLFAAQAPELSVLFGATPLWQGTGTATGAALSARRLIAPAGVAAEGRRLK